jgi:hypothetical protein
MSLIETTAPRRHGNSKYDASMCDRAIELGNEGCSRAEIAVALGISRKVLYEWLDTIPAFRDAIEMAVAAAQAWHERLGRQHMVTSDGVKFNATAYIFTMKNRFRDDYRDDAANTAGTTVNISIGNDYLDRLIDRREVIEALPKRDK